MKFIALLYKELRECLPLVLAASVLLIGCGFIGIWMNVSPRALEYHYHIFTSGSDIETYQPSVNPDITWYLFYVPFISGAGVLLFVFTVGLALALGVRQYWIEFFTRTWGFLLHRSIKRITVLYAKLIAGLISFLPMAIIWTIFYIYGFNKKYFPIPPPARTFIEGLIFITFGYVVYLAAALAGLSTTRWYTTKMISLAFAIWMLITLMMQWQLGWAWLAIIVSVIILLTQIVDVFLNREFE
jgi:hypothetical protein